VHLPGDNFVCKLKEEVVMTVMMSRRIMRKVFADPHQKVVKGEPVLLTTGAKGTYYGNDIWEIRGYSQDNSDAANVLAQLALYAVGITPVSEK
jgi:hypothetical protein